MKEQFILRLPKEMKDRLRKEAGERGLSLTALIIVILGDYIRKVGGKAG